MGGTTRFFGPPSIEMTGHVWAQVALFRPGNQHGRP